MGLFDFAKNIGNKIFGKDDDPAEKIQQHIEKDNPGIDNLKIVYNDGKAVISGDAATSEAIEKAILMAGNARGVEMVDASAVTGAAPNDNVEYYVVQKGDSLSAIAKKLLGNAMDYPKIFEANREVIKDPDLIFPGQKIRIPR
jgi:nucleoid-associated protein YgaU